MCEVCQKFKHPPSRPVAGLPLADNFNQVVCMDLKEYIHNKVWILHLIDAATRYSAACLIRTKHPEEIIRCVYLIWIAYFGSPKKIFSDNGGEFSNETYREMNEKIINIVTLTTAGESPFSNGTVERHNSFVSESMKKTIQYVKCLPEVALAWAISPKNSLQNHGGFSPNQLVFGHNINLSLVLTNALPALENSTSSDIIRKNMEAMQKAWENYIQAESSECIRALRHNVRTYADERYCNGDKVYYDERTLMDGKVQVSYLVRMDNMFLFVMEVHIVVYIPASL